MKLKVAEAFSQSDVGRSIARIDPSCMEKLDLVDGDMIEIEGKKLTATTVASSQSDIGLEIIRIDGYIRKNAGTSLGEEVIVRKAQVKEAQKVVMAPVDQRVMIRGDVKRAFQGRVLSKGDIIVTGIRQQQTAMRGSLFDEFFRDTMTDVSPMGELKLAVVATKPAGVVKVTEITDVEIQTDPVDVSKLEGVKTLVDVTYEDIGGLKEEVKKVREMVEIPLKRPELFERLGISPPKGVLMHGPPGTGKTLLAKAVANESKANFIAVKGPELLSKWVGESEKGVREVFRKARQTAPTVIFFDEIDSIASTRAGGSTDSGVTQRVVNQLLTEIDGLEELQDVAVIAATNRVDIMDPALLRPGRFDRHVKVDDPDENARLEIFKVHTKNMPLADDVDLDYLAKNTDKYVGADIEAVCREAVMLTLRNDIQAENVKMEQFKKAMKKVKTEEQVNMVQYH